ncbi:MAG: sensor domain-containing protein [Chloroflexota bacterium]
MSAAPEQPAEAPAARRRRHPVVGFLLSPVSAGSWWALLSILVGLVITVAAFSLVTSLFSMGGGLLILLVGFPIVALGIEAARLVARVERWRVSVLDDRPLLPHPYRPVGMSIRAPYGPWLRQWAEAEFLDVNRWLDVAYVLIAMPLAVLEFIVVVTIWALSTGLLVSPAIYLLAQAAGAPVEVRTGGLALGAPEALGLAFLVGLILLPVAASVTRGLGLAHRAVVEGMLCTSPAAALRIDNERLRGSRSAAIELEASELRRIERDLHDGAQQRLVMLAIDLTLAEDKLDADPAAARTLIAGARDQARQALAELRDVVRGAAPAILLDRGLPAALSAVASRSAVPTFVDSRLEPGERLPHAVERAGYYVVSETITNIAKHAGATRCDVLVRTVPGHLLLDIRDDGRGGARVVEGGGLAGLRDRVEGLDGHFSVRSPDGGPTVISAELPIGPS